MINKGRATKYRILEALFAVCLFAVAIGIRVYNMPTQVYGLGNFYELSAVDGREAVKYVPGSGITQVYLYMLRGLFLIFGNIWQVGTIAQIVLFFLGGCVFYFAVRKVSGRVGSLLVSGILLCLPHFLPITYSYGPQMLYFLLFGMGLYYTHGLVVGAKDEEGFGILFFLKVILTGLYAGLLIYLDIFGLVLLLPMFFVPFFLKENLGIIKGLGSLFLWVLSAAVGVFLCGMGECLCFGATANELVAQWLLYSLRFRQDMHIWLGIAMGLTYFATLVYFVIYLVFKRSSRAVRELDVEGLLKNQIEEAKETQGKEIVAEEKETVAEGNETVAEEQAPEQVVQFIENPLPLPKKHVKKTLDYAFEPDFEDMDYDIHTFEKNDYDL